MKTDPQPTGHKQSHSYYTSFCTSVFSLWPYNNRENFCDEFPLFSIFFHLPPLLDFQILQIKLYLFQPPQMGPASPTLPNNFFFTTVQTAHFKFLSPSSLFYRYTF